MTTQDQIDFYVALLIAQYGLKPNARASVEAFVRAAVADQVEAQVRDGFKFTVSPVGQPTDGAAGVQLDAVAAYRGAQRVIYGLAPNNYFQLPDAADANANAALGFMDAVTGVVPYWYFLTAENTNTPIYSLTDDQLYRLTQFRAAVLSSDHSIKSIDVIMENFFGNNAALFDNGNMTILYVDLTSDTDSLFSVAALTNSLPRPAGVGLTAIRADLLSNFFGLQDTLTGLDSSFAGFSDALTTLTTGTFISAP